jgi:hypothetical protein
VLWERFSIWLIVAGLILAGLAAIAYVIDLASGRQIDSPAWPRVVGYALAVLLSLMNAFVHSRDGYTAVVPTGLMLSGHRRSPADVLGWDSLGKSPSLWRTVMMHALRIARSPKLPRLAALFVAIAGLGLAGCDDNGGDPKRQIGANPVLPALQQYLMPPIRIAKAVGWGENETPTVPQGLQVHALASGFVHPRSLYVLPNGDVLVVESNGPKAPIHRPKDIITGWVQSFAGAKAKDDNRITLLRDTNGDGIPEVRTVFLDHLNSPFGIALVGHNLYVANTDAIIRYPYQEGQTSITVPGTKLTDLPGGPIDHHWTKPLLAPARMVPSSGSAPTATESARNMNAPLSGRSTEHRAPIAFRQRRA